MIPKALRQSAAITASLIISVSPLHAREMAKSSDAPVIGKTFAESRPGSVSRPTAREGTPNVLIWMIDDLGFGQIGSFGGPVETPNIDRVARLGLRFTNYHTTPVCSASRAALLTGRNPHNVHIGGHSSMAIGFPGQDAMIPRAAGTIAENLRGAGYVTYALGKWDHLPPSDASPVGPFTYWPSGQGFDRFYGFLGFDANNFKPTLWSDHSPAQVPSDPSYHLSRDLADRAVEWISQRDTTDPARPFMMYWATGASHAPHHAPQAWLDHYRGAFDKGWDVVAEDVLAKQIRLGIVPNTTVRPPHPPGMAAWNDLSPDQRKMYARQMEAFAAQLSHADEQFGRILDVLEARGELDNTIIVITSDNGASAEGAENGTFNEMYTGSNYLADLKQNLGFYENWGGPATYPHYALGWAVAGNTPFRYYKQTAYEGGIHVPLLIAWPRGIAAKGQLRSQFHFVTDLTPTILDAARIDPLTKVNGERQMRFDGMSMRYAFASSAAPTRRKVQYFEMYGNRAIIADGWKAVVPHRLETWKFLKSAPFSTDRWELFDLGKDPNEMTNLASAKPEKLKQMVALFDREARRNNVYPLTNIEDPMTLLRTQKLADLKRRNGMWNYNGRIMHVPEGSAPPLASMNFSLTAELMLGDNARGTIFAMGGMYGGLAVHFKNGRPVFAYRSMDLRLSEITSSKPLPKGKVKLVVEFERTGASTAAVKIVVDGEVVGSGQIAGDLSRGYFSPTETFDIGDDTGTGVLDKGTSAGAFNGVIERAQFHVSLPR